MPQTVLTGKPLLDGTDVLVASTTGTLYRISVADGKLVAQTSAGEPISGTPLIASDSLLVPGDEGSILRLPLAFEGKPVAEVTSGGVQ
jgi:hypothetical protein